MHRELIDKIIQGGDNKAMECLKDITIDLIDHIKHCDHDWYKKIEFKLYRLVYGEHLTEELAKEWVEDMDNKDGTTGEHWTMEQTSQFAGNHNKADWYATLNMVYSDYYNPRFDTNTYVQLANDWLDDKDVENGKLLRYYMFIVK